MEDFANILQRNYGLKPHGKSAPMAGGVGGPGHSRAGSGADMGRTGSGGRSARRVGEEDDLFFNSGNGNSKGSNRYSESSDVFGSTTDDIFGAAPPKSSGSGAVYDDVFGGPSLGVSPSNSFGDLLGGFSTSGSRPPPNQNSFSDDLLGGFGTTKPRASSSRNPSSSVGDIFSGGPGQTERSSSRSTSGNNNVEDSFLGAFGISKPEPQVTQSQTMFDNDWGFGTSKPAPRTGTLHASIDGDLLGGFATSASRAKSSTPFRSPQSSPPRANRSEPIFDEFLPGFGAGDQKRAQPSGDANAFRGIPIITTTDDDDVFNGIPSATSASDADPFQGIPTVKSTGDADAFRGIPPVISMDADEMRGIPPVTSAVLVDDDPFSTTSEVDPFANISTDSGIPGPSPAASFPDPLDPFSMPPAPVPSSSSATEDNVLKGSKTDMNGGSGSFDPFDGLSQPPPIAIAKVKEGSVPSRTGSGSDGKEGSQGSSNREERSARRSFNGIPFNVDLNETPEVASPTYPSGSYKASTESDLNGFAPKFDDEPKFAERTTMRGEEGRNGETVVDNPPVDIFEEKWLTIDDVKLVTEPSSSSPPSRAPPRPGLDKRSSGSRGTSEYREKAGEAGSLRDRIPRERDRARQDEQAVYRSRPKVQEPSKEVELERERAAAREREVAMVQKEREAAQRDRDRAERQRERERQRDRLREQEMAREADAAKERSAPKQEEVTEREADHAMERAKKAAQRAALEAQMRVEKAAAERAFIEARERAEKAALQRAAAARDKERMEREEREKRGKEERERREREERAKREKEERAKRDKAREEREREREKREREERERERERDRERDRRRERERGAAEQPRPTSASSRATSEPRQRPATNQPSPFASEVRRPSPGNPVYSSTGSAPTPTARKPQTPVKVVDDWTTLLTQTAPTGDEFQEIPGEAPERRKLRLERHQRMAERAAQALKEKNDRDKAQLMEQAERSMAAGNLDAEIRRWATGKEGNLRALLSSLHLLLWPECNWKPLSLTDLITGISVKKAYQRAILCVHPDKVQQKGATVQQKYIAEKVFDLLKDAFAKFNSTELY